MCFRPSQDRIKISIVFDAKSKTFLSNSRSHGLTVFSNKHMQKSWTYHGLLHILVREKTVYLWACSAHGNCNLDSEEILWLFDCQV